MGGVSPADGEGAPDGRAKKSWGGTFLTGPAPKGASSTSQLGEGRRRSRSSSARKAEPSGEGAPPPLSAGALGGIVGYEAGEHVEIIPPSDETAESCEAAAAAPPEKMFAAKTENAKIF